MDIDHNWDMADNMTDTSYIDELMLDERQSLFTYTLHQPTTIALVCLYIPVMVTSFVGNILVIVVVIRHRKCWGVTSNFLTNLAFADLLVSTVCLPMTVAQIIYVPWPYGAAMCKVTAYAQGIAVTASTFTLTAMSLDRCLAIRYPIKFRSVRTSKNIRRLLFLVWILSGGLMSPLGVYKNTTSHALFDDVKYCVETWDSIRSRQIYDLSLLIFLYIVPCFVVLFSYGIMGRRLWMTDKVLTMSVKSHSPKNTGKKSAGNVLNGRRKFAKMLIAVSILFAMSWLPYYITTVFIDFKSTKAQSNLMLVVSSFSLFLGHSNSATNPIIYCLMNRAFRRYLVSMIRCRRSSHLSTQLLVSARSSRGSTMRGMKTSLVGSLKLRSTPNSYSTQTIPMADLNKGLLLTNGSYSHFKNESDETCFVNSHVVINDVANEQLSSLTETPKIGATNSRRIGFGNA